MNLRQNTVLLTGNGPLIGAALAAGVILLLAFGGPARPDTDQPGFAEAGATNPAETRLTTTGDAQFAAWAPDSRTLLYTRWSRTEPISTGWQVITDLWQTNPDGTGHDLLASNAAYPAYSPDGKGLAYLSFLGQGRGELWILENGTKQRLAQADWGRAVSWTGRGILAAQGGRPMLLRPDRAAPGGVSAQGLPWPEGTGLYPSPAGDMAAQVGPDGISLWNARGALVKTIATDPGVRVGDLDWSPDGTKLAYSVQGTSEGPELGVANVAGGRERRLIKGDLVAGLPEPGPEPHTNRERGVRLERDLAGERQRERL
ncbi:MAG: PD40 domain-containing protein [Chloroflexi bacterium]|nr:PD40 domain-containing protein [Chloroflexota bacterium]